MRVLFVTNPAEGHFYPMVPLAWALRSAGADVLVTAPEAFAGEVIGAGLPVRANCGPLDMIETMRPDNGDGPPRQAPSQDEVRRNTAKGFAKLAALALPGTLDVVASWRPDVIVAESAALAAPVAAEKFGVPYLEHRWGLAVAPELSAIAGEELAAMSGHGDRAIPVGVLDVCPPSFQRQDAPQGHRFRYVPYNGPAQLSDWVLRPRTKPRVCLTLGTVLPRYGQVTSLLEQSLEALSTMDVEVVVAMREDDRGRLERPDRLPDQLRTAEWLPLGVVLPVCDAVVHHGGSGTTLTTLVHGLPQVALPHFADQFANAERVGQVGVGIALLPSATNEESLAAAISAVLEDGRYAAAARQVAAEIAEQPTPAEAVRVVEAAGR